jgi:hypothetical protein
VRDEKDVRSRQAAGLGATKGLTKAIHDQTMESVQHASVDQAPLVSRESVAAVPLTGLSFSASGGIQRPR